MLSPQREARSIRSAKYAWCNKFEPRVFGVMNIESGDLLTLESNREVLLDTYIPVIVHFRQVVGACDKEADWRQEWVAGRLGKAVINCVRSFRTAQ